MRDVRAVHKLRSSQPLGELSISGQRAVGHSTVIQNEGPLSRGSWRPWPMSGQQSFAGSSKHSMFGAIWFYLISVLRCPASPVPVVAV